MTVPILDTTSPAPSSSYGSPPRYVTPTLDKQPITSASGYGPIPVTEVIDESLFIYPDEDLFPFTHF